MLTADRLYTIQSFVTFQHTTNCTQATTQQSTNTTNAYSRTVLHHLHYRTLQHDICVLRLQLNVTVQCAHSTEGALTETHYSTSAIGNKEINQAKYSRPQATYCTSPSANSSTAQTQPPIDKRRLCRRSNRNRNLEYKITTLNLANRHTVKPALFRWRISDIRTPRMANQTKTMSGRNTKHVCRTPDKKLNNKPRTANTHKTFTPRTTNRHTTTFERTQREEKFWKDYFRVGTFLSRPSRGRLQRISEILQESCLYIY